MALWIIIYALCTIADRVTAKLTSVGMYGESKISYYLYYATHSMIACLFFLAMGKFNVNINGVTLIYSLTFGFTVLLSLLLRMAIFRHVNVLGSGVLSTPFMLLLTALVGSLVWNEEITRSKYFAIFLTSISAVFIFIDIRLISKKQKNGQNIGPRVNLKIFIPLMVASVIITVAQNSIINAFANSTSVTDENSFYFLTNLVMLAWACVMLAFTALTGGDKLIGGIVSFFKPKRVLPTATNVIFSNITALAMIPILAELDISTFTPLSSAFSIVVGVLVSLIFREKLGIFSYISAAIAIVAIFV